MARSKKNPWNKRVADDPLTKPQPFHVVVGRGKQHLLAVLPGGKIKLVDHPQWKLELKRENARVSLLPDGRIPQGETSQLCPCFFVKQVFIELFSESTTGVPNVLPTGVLADPRAWSLKKLSHFGFHTGTEIKEAGLHAKDRTLAKRLDGLREHYQQVERERNAHRAFRREALLAKPAGRHEAIKKTLYYRPADDSLRKRSNGVSDFSIPGSGIQVHIPHLTNPMRRHLLHYQLVLASFGINKIIAVDGRTAGLGGNATLDHRNGTVQLHDDGDVTIAAGAHWQTIPVMMLFNGLAVFRGAPALAWNGKLHEVIRAVPLDDQPDHWGVRRERVESGILDGRVLAAGSVHPIHVGPINCAPGGLWTYPELAIAYRKAGAPSKALVTRLFKATSSPMEAFWSEPWPE